MQRPEPIQRGTDANVRAPGPQHGGEGRSSAGARPPGLILLGAVPAEARVALVERRHALGNRGHWCGDGPGTRYAGGRRLGQRPGVEQVRQDQPGHQTPDQHQGQQRQARAHDAAPQVPVDEPAVLCAERRGPSPGRGARPPATGHGRGTPARRRNGMLLHRNLSGGFIWRARVDVIPLPASSVDSLITDTLGGRASPTYRSLPLLPGPGLCLHPSFPLSLDGLLSSPYTCSSRPDSAGAAPGRRSQQPSAVDGGGSRWTLTLLSRSQPTSVP